MKSILVAMAVFSMAGVVQAQGRDCRRQPCGPNRPGPNRPGPNRPDPRPNPGPNRPGPNRPDPRPNPGPNRPGPNRPDPRPAPGPYRPGPTRPDPRPYPMPGPNRPHRDRYDGDRDWRMHDRVGHRPNYNRPNAPYTTYRHIPRHDRMDHPVHYVRPYDFYRTLSYRNIYFNRWIRIGVSYGDGYYYNNNYPYYVYNGYMHRYSRYDMCDYHLVDGVQNYTVQSFYGMSCADAYDRCADLRDSYNQNDYSYRYFCSEELVNGSGYDYNWNYDDDFYYDYQDDYYSSNDPYRY